MTGKVRDMGRKVAVVGGGAAGMMAAVQAAYAGARVTVYERNDRVGKKILSTGNGKCNFSNEDMRAACYYGSGAGYVDGFYKQFGVAETKTFFRELGMRIKDRNGYLYPAGRRQRPGRTAPDWRWRSGLGTGSCRRYRRLRPCAAERLSGSR